MSRWLLHAGRPRVEILVPDAFVFKKKYPNAHKSGSSFLCSFCDGRNGRECLESVWRCGGALSINNLNMFFCCMCIINISTEISREEETCIIF